MRRWISYICLVVNYAERAIEDRDALVEMHGTNWWLNKSAFEDWWICWFEEKTYRFTTNKIREKNFKHTRKEPNRRNIRRKDLRMISFDHQAILEGQFKRALAYRFCCSSCTLTGSFLTVEIFWKVWLSLKTMVWSAWINLVILWCCCGIYFRPGNRRMVDYHSQTAS